MLRRRIIQCLLAAACCLLPLKPSEARQFTQYEQNTNIVYDMLNQATALMKSERNVDARILLEKAATYDPNKNSVHVHQLLAEVYHNLGNAAGSVTELERAMQFAPKEKSVAWNLALGYKDLCQYDRAIASAQRYLTMNPELRMKQQAERLIKDLQEQKQSQVFSDPHSLDYLDQLAQEHNAHQWQLEKLPIKVFVTPGNDVYGYNPNFMLLLADSFNTWVKASGYKLSYFFVNNPNQADLVVIWTSNPQDLAMDNSGAHVEQGLARTFVGEPDLDGISRIRKGTIHLLTIKGSTGAAISEEQMKETCLHEIGHAFGLNGHSQNASDIMYFSKSSRQLPALTKRDKATIARLYQNYPARPLPIR